MKNFFSVIGKVWVVFTCMLMFVCIPMQNVLAAYEPAKAAKITEFTVSKKSITLGEVVTLSWKTENAVKVNILGVEKTEEDTLPLNGSIKVAPMATTNYKLTATNADGKIVSSSLTVTVDTEEVEAVRIDAFDASSSETVAGGKVTLSWKVTGASKVTLIAGGSKEEGLSLNGSKVVYPKATTTYILEALGKDGQVARKSVTVKVGKPPEGTNSLVLSHRQFNDWGDEYIINYDITNTSDKNVNDWRLLFKKSQFNIKLIWGADMEESGDTVIITPLHYNKLIKAGGTVEFGIQGYGSPVENYYYRFDASFDK